MKTTIRVLTVSMGLALGLLSAASGFAQTATPPVMPTKPATPAKTAMADKMADTKAAAGGGAGKVWVNASSKTYHCEGTKFYGKTKTGEYASEAEAKAKGNRAAKGKGCAM